MDVAPLRARSPQSGYRGPSSGHHEHSEVSYSVSRSRHDGQQSLGGACCGAGFGVLLLLGATALLWMNEGVAVRTARSLDEASTALFRLGDVEDAPIGALVHAAGMLRTPGPLQDDAFGISTNGLSLKRVPEVYQWKEHKSTSTRKVRGSNGQMLDEKVTKYSYDSIWSGSAISSGSFNDRSFSNPSWHAALDTASSRGGVPFSADAWRQESVTLEGFELSTELRSQAEQESGLGPRTLPAPAASAVLVGEHVYSSRACANKPSVGCARLRWSHAPAQVVSVLAAKLRTRLKPWPSVQGDGYDIGMVSFGEVSANSMLAGAKSSNTAWTWVKRLGGAFLIWVGWGLVLGPASYIASWVPLVCQLSRPAPPVSRLHPTLHLNTRTSSHLPPRATRHGATRAELHTAPARASAARGRCCLRRLTPKRCREP